MLCVVPAASCSKAHEHVYGEWEVVTEAGCETPGSKRRTCECGDEITETIPALGHNFVNGICTDCGKSEGEA